MSAKEALSELHTVVAKELLDVIKNGNVKITKDDDVVRVKADPAYFNAAIKFLKDNGVNTIPDDVNIRDLMGALAFPEDEELYKA